MKKPLYGPSIYYATDKNVFDALNQYKVTRSAIQLMFLRRNIIVSRETPRVDLAAYFSLLNHDYIDHKDIAKRLGVVSRRERTTSMAIDGVKKNSALTSAIEDVKRLLEETGDVVKISKYDGRIVVAIQYSTVDYRRSEFTQTQQHIGRIEFIGNGPEYVVRNTHSDHVDRARDEILDQLSKTPEVALEKSYISLQPFPSPEDRSSFFNDLINELDGFVLHDVKEALAYKARPGGSFEDAFDEDEAAYADDDDESETDESGGEDSGQLAVDDDAELGSHIEHVNLKGVGVTRSGFLIDALEDDYYIVRIRWEAKKELTPGSVYVIEALFTDPRDCNEFSFMLKGVFPFENGRLSNRQAAPHPEDIDNISRAVEKAAQRLIAQLKTKHAKGASGDGDPI